MLIEIISAASYIALENEHLVYSIIQIFITCLLFFITMRLAKQEKDALTIAFTALLIIQVICVLFTIVKLFNE